MEPNEPMTGQGSEPASVPPVEPGRGRPLLTLAIVILVTVGLIGFAAHFSKQGPVSTGAALEGLGQAAPDFLVKDIRGNTFRLSDLKGKVVVLDFWATWCGHCQEEIPWFIDIYNRYKAQGLEVVGVSMDEETEVVKPFAERYRMNYHVVLGNDSVAGLFGGIYGLPTTFIIDRDGKIRGKHMGLVKRSTIEESVQKLL
jgi:peroxiredoxin